MLICVLEFDISYVMELSEDSELSTSVHCVTGLPLLCAKAILINNKIHQPHIHKTSRHIPQSTILIHIFDNSPIP